MGIGNISDKIEDLEVSWIDSLGKWFEDGINTPDITLIHVKADSVKYWDGEDSGEFKV